MRHSNILSTARPQYRGLRQRENQGLDGRSAIPLPQKSPKAKIVF
jgi:hypothetical protein